MDSLDIAIDTVMQMLHRRDARLDHLERRIQGIEVGVDVPLAGAVHGPLLQRQIGRAELEGSEAHVMMTVDEAGQYDMPLRAQHIIGRIFCRQRVVFADFDDHAVALEHRPIFNDCGLIAVEDLADNVFAAD